MEDEMTEEPGVDPVVPVGGPPAPDEVTSPPDPDPGDADEVEDETGDDEDDGAA
jgi:hypothetical protein